MLYLIKILSNEIYVIGVHSAYVLMMKYLNKQTL